MAELGLVQKVAHGGVDADDALVRQWRIVVDLVDVDLTAPPPFFGFRCLGALADHVPSLQQNAATNAVRLRLLETLRKKTRKLSGLL